MKLAGKLLLYVDSTLSNEQYIEVLIEKVKGNTDSRKTYFPVSNHINYKDNMNSPNKYKNN